MYIFPTLEHSQTTASSKPEPQPHTEQQQDTQQQAGASGDWSVATSSKGRQKARNKSSDGSATAERSHVGHQMGEHQQRAATNRPSGAPCHNVTQSLGERGAAGGSSNGERQSARRGVRPQQVPNQEAASVSGDRYSLTPHEGTLPHPQPSARPSI